MGRNIISRHLYILIILTSFTIKSWAQISPGDLTNAHSDLEGISNCTKCHEIGEKVNNSKCLDCHTEIKSLVNEGLGYHSSSEVKSKNCSSCHNEHHGRNFRIVNFDAKSFDHNKTGFTLTGKHSSTDCKKCHKSEFIDYSKLKITKETYLGLNQNCTSCHEDFHQKTLGDNCTKCHNTDAFRPAPKFDHSSAAFKLNGAHLKVDCIGCHKVKEKNGNKYQAFKNVPFQNCNACHKDIHEGRFGQNCSSCHQTSSFKQINSSAFDHSRTKFPLVGKHKLVACNNCHKNPSGYKMKFELCTDCHSDFHKAQFVVNNTIRNCGDCHTELGFGPSLFTFEMHNKSKFQLSGAHLATPCESCHYQQNEWHFKGTNLECSGCHENIHKNELKTEFLPDNKCQYCHETENWNTIKFDHNKTSFALLGKHSSVSCGSCHRGKESEQGQILFSSIKKECSNCHQDVHFGQFNFEGISDCGRCHTFENWIPEKFDHNKTEFKLEGAHEKVECSRCHPKSESKGNVFTKFKLEEFRCATCHTK